MNLAFFTNSTSTYCASMSQYEAQVVAENGKMSNTCLGKETDKQATPKQ